MRRLAALVTVAVLALMVGVLGAPAANAHSFLVSSNPADGAKVDRGPATVSLRFNEALQATTPALVVVGPGADRSVWTTGAPAVNGPTISAPVGTLGKAGTYAINYRVTSGDGHVVEGTIRFTLTADQAGTPASEATPNGGRGIPAWPFVVGGVLVVGTVLMLLLRRPGKR